VDATPAQPIPTPGIPTEVNYSGPWLYVLSTAVTGLIALYIRHLDDQKRKAIAAEDEVKRAALHAEEVARRILERQWEAEDRARIASELTASTARAEAHGRKILSEMQTQHRATSAAINENTRFNVEALSAANALNAKILHIRQLVKELPPEAQAELDIFEKALEQRKEGL
jgi:hypothetical protein